MTETEFVEQVKQLGINSTEEQLSKLEKLYEIMIEENKVMNLTRIISKADVYLKHFYDSLTITKVCDLTGNLTLCDVGTGAGFPGLVLKPEAGIHYRIAENWSAGAEVAYMFMPQFCKLYDKGENFYGQFMTVSVAARYYF